MSKREQIYYLLRETPSLTQRAVASTLGVSPGYVHLVREEMYRTGDLVRPARWLPQRSPGTSVRSLITLMDTGQTFGTILADPPWAYANQGTRGATSRPKKFHYATMTLMELAALPVADLAAPDAHLHLWATKDFLFAAGELMNKWGFSYRSILVWDKDQLGTGNYWRIQTEFLLLGIKGNAKRFRRKDLGNIVRNKRGPHSRKPDIVRARIEQVSPGPYLELFGRECVDGWTVFGDQIGQGIFSDH